MTTIANVFLTTAKNTVTIIRQMWPSVVEAFKILFINPNGYRLGDRIRAAVKILATGASVVAGVIVAQLVSSSGIGLVPIVGDIISSFCGAFVSGILSCTFVYFLDRSTFVNKLVDFLNDPLAIGKLLDYYERYAAYLDEFAAKLLDIDIERFRKETAMYSSLANQVANVRSETELNKPLYKAADTAGVKIPWGTHEKFDSFMRDKNARMVFE